MISIILPTYNEKENILSLIQSICHIIDQIENIKYEIIVVDDNSPDGTSMEIEKYKNDNNNKNNIVLITRKEECGLASAIKTGIKNSKGEYIIIMDTDFSHPPELIENLINIREKSDIDLVIASRYIKGGSMQAKKYKFLLSKIMNLLVGFFLNLKVKDVTGGFFIIKKSLLNKINLDKVFIGYGDYFFRLLYELRQENYSFKEIPFKYLNRRAGESKTKTFNMGIDYIKTMILLRFKS